MIAAAGQGFFDNFNDEVVGMHEQIECVLGCWVLTVGCGPLSWSCCDHVMIFFTAEWIVRVEVK